jgi:hypothetical protein
MRASCLLATLLLVIGCTSPNLGAGGGGSGGSGGGGSAGSGGGGSGGSGGGGSGGSGGGGSGGSGGVTISGGSGPLAFGVFGDARPANIPPTTSGSDPATGYPTQVLTGIFNLAQQKGAKFMVGTGDYMYADTQAQVDAQLALFGQAHAGFSGPLYLAMGNHECNGYTDSNCPALNEYPNVRSFVKLLPSGVSSPWYRVDFDTPSGKAKFLFVAANAWSTAQEDWLKTQLADPTTYTLVVRHEPATNTHGTAPGAQPSEALLTGAAFTLELLGHTHEYRHEDLQHVISGNAGAPISGGSHYGFLLIEQGTDGRLTATEYDQATGQATDTWTITADGKSS